MSLISYVEPVNGLEGLATLLIAGTMCYIFYRLYIKIVQLLDVYTNREIKYALLEETYLDDIASKKGIDLNKELIKKKIISETPKSLQRKIRDKMYSDLISDKNK